MSRHEVKQVAMSYKTFCIYLSD